MEKYFTTHRLINIILIIHIKQHEKKYYCFPWAAIIILACWKKDKDKEALKTSLKGKWKVESYPFAKYRLQRTASDQFY